jgi:hypothetical protein
MADFSRAAEAFGGGAMGISPFSLWSVGPSAIHLPNNTSPGSTAWPAANRVLAIPFRIPRTVTIYQIVVGCGATAGGNFDAGIYDWAGNRLVAAGSTGRSANVEVVCNITDTVLQHGRYYMCLQVDGTSNMMANTAAQAGLSKAVGLKQASPGSFPLPSTLTWETVASGFTPMGICLYMVSN